MLQFYRPLQHSLATPHSVHSFPHAPNPIRNYGTSLDDNIVGYHFRDRERELYERQIEFEHELDRERFVNETKKNKKDVKTNKKFFCNKINRNCVSFTEWQHWPHQCHHYHLKQL